MKKLSVSTLLLSSVFFSNAIHAQQVAVPKIVKLQIKGVFNSILKI